MCEAFFFFAPLVSIHTQLRSVGGTPCKAGSGKGLQSGVTLCIQVHNCVLLGKDSRVHPYGHVRLQAVVVRHGRTLRIMSLSLVSLLGSRSFSIYACV